MSSGNRRYGGWSFNSRTPKGCDNYLRPIRQLQEVSIHAPLKGATLPYYEVDEKWIVSIHAPLKGATLYSRDGVPLDQVSIHAPLKGATVVSMYSDKLQDEFQFTHP